MRSIHVPATMLRAARWGSGLPGARIEFPVAVDWPELRLTEDQVMANAIARAWGLPEPYEDHSTFAISLDRF
jgi:hypothetical protein